MAPQRLHTLYTNKTLNPSKLTLFPLNNWYPNAQNTPKPKPEPINPNPSQHFFQSTQRLSPIARYICDSINKHRAWGPDVISDLGRLRRVDRDTVAQVLKALDAPQICSKFFHWAGKQKGFHHNFITYNAFIYALYRLNHYRASEQVPELMRIHGVNPTEKQFEILIRKHNDHGRGLRVYYVYEMMRKFGVKPRVFLYNRVMDGLIRTGHLGLALSVYEDFKKDGCVEESVTFMILVKGLCKSGKIEEMLEVLRRMRRVCKPDVFAYTAMIRVLVEEGNVDGCLRVWDEMKKDRVEPDAMAYRTLVSALCKGGRVLEGYAIFQGVKKKGGLIDRGVYESLVEGFVAVGKVGSALDLWKDMVDSGYRADLGIYNCLIQGLCNSKQPEKAVKLIQVLIDEGLQPEFTTVIPILVSYADSKELGKFCSLLDRVEKLGVCVADGLEKFFSEKFFSLMVEREDGLPTTLTTFEDLNIKGYCSIRSANIVLRALYNCGQTQTALSLFNDIKDSNAVPDSSTYSYAIMCHVDLGDMKEACSWYNRIIETNSVPLVEAYQSLVKGLCKMREIDLAILLVRDCLGNVTSGPTEFKYTLTIIHMCKSNNADKVLDVVNELIEQRGLVDDIICCAVISGMCNHGSNEEARKVFSSFHERKLVTEANSIFYEDMLEEYSQKKLEGVVNSVMDFYGLEFRTKRR